MSRLELSLAWRYMRSRRGSKLLSVISLIAIGGVTVAVSALIVIIGVMNGLQNDLREKILIGSPDIRVMTYGNEMVMTDWQTVLDKVRRQPGVVAAGPFVHTQAVVNAVGRKYFEAAFVEGIPPDGPGVPQITAIRNTRIAGDFSCATLDGRERDVVIGKRLAERVPGIERKRLLLGRPVRVRKGEDERTRGDVSAVWLLVHVVPVDVPVEDRHVLVAVGENPRRQNPADARTEDDGVAAPVSRRFTCPLGRTGICH